MISKLSAIAVIALTTCSFAVAGSRAIGTASARGDMVIDGESVKGNATLFEGTVVATTQATTTLRLNTGTEIKLATGSSGTLYGDRIVLQRGTSEFTPSSPFSLQANGLSVTSSAPNSRAVVSMSGSNVVDVTTVAGAVQVINERGVLLARVIGGRTASFALQQPTPGSGQVRISGQIIKADGHYFIVESVSNARYEITGRSFFWAENQEVTVTGTFDKSAPPVSGATGVIRVSALTRIPVSGVSPGIGNAQSFVLLGTIAAIAVGIYAGVAEATGPASPASR